MKKRDDCGILTFYLKIFSCLKLVKKKNYGAISFFWSMKVRRLMIHTIRTVSFLLLTLRVLKKTKIMEEYSAWNY